MSVKILVVDDLSDMRMLLGLTIKRNAWDVVEAFNGMHAIETAKREQPNVILMDYDMPEMNGLDACAVLTQDPETSHIPVIIYTGYGALHVREEALQRGATTFLIKPITPARLREEIENLL